MCYHPWVGLDINPQGQFRPCCKFSSSLGNSLDEYLNNPKLKQLKYDFQIGKRPIECSRCWSDEDAGLASKRTIDNEYIFKGEEPQLKDTKVLSLPFGNTCNLACRTCGSASSSRWAQEEKKLQNKFDITIYSHQQFYKNKQFIDNIKKVSSELIDITFLGGESFVAGIPQQLEFLDYILTKDPTKISLTYITNTTVFPSEEFWSRWSKFKNINIQLSIDGIDSKFEYLRWPAKWKQCYDNIKQYQQRDIQLSISHTVSVFNVYYLPEFFAWCKEQNLPVPYIGMVTNPPQYNIKNLPQQIKDKIQFKLNGQFETVINYMNRTKLDTNITEWIKELDLMRSQNFAKTFPEIKDLIIG